MKTSRRILWHMSPSGCLSALGTILAVLFLLVLIIISFLQA